MQPMISVIIPTYNRKDMLKKMIKSIEEQTYDNYEIIVIDDGSTDDTENEILELINENQRIHYYKNDTNMGPGYNRNKGYILSKGDYIVFADDDDYYTDSSFFEKAINIYINEVGLACVSANSTTLYVDTGKQKKGNVGILGRVNGIEFLTNIEVKYHKPLSTFPSIFSRTALEQADLKNMKMVNDYAIYLRALLYGDMYVLDEFVGMYCQHENNISYSIARDFLIDNIEERYWVKRKLGKKISDTTAKKWWYIQVRILMTYYIINANASSSDTIYVIKWIRKNTESSIKLWLMLIIHILKIKLKSIFSKK